MNVCVPLRVRCDLQLHLAHWIAVVLLVMVMPACAAETRVLQLKCPPPFQRAGFYVVQGKTAYRDAGQNELIRKAVPSMVPAAKMTWLPVQYSSNGLLYAETIECSRDVRSWFWVVSALVVLGLGLSGLVLIFFRLYHRLKREISDRKEVSAVLANQQRDFRFITEHSADVIWTLDLASGRFIYISPSVLRLRGYTVEEVMRQSVLETLTPESATHVELFLAEAVARWKAGDHGARVTEVDQPHKDGHIVHVEVVTTVHGDENGNSAFMLGVTRDITERRKAEAFMRSLAFHDSLTMLPNRRLLLDRLQQAIFRARRDQTRVALMFLDLDEFKPINDRLGHAVGDWLLIQVAARMLSCVRESDTVARLGGDEFLVLLPSVEWDADALAVAEKIRQALNQPFITVAGESLQISSSTGVVFYPDHGSNETMLLTCADEAMYQAKEAGRNQVQVFHAKASPSEQSVVSSLNWKPVYACGDARIDADHRLLFELGNSLMAASERCKDEPEIFLMALDDLVKHTIMHFAHEESVLAELGYSELAQHAEEHCRLVARAKALQLAAQQEVLNITQLVDYLNQDVIAGHMIAEDLKFFHLFHKPH